MTNNAEIVHVRIKPTTKGYREYANVDFTASRDVADKFIKNNPEFYIVEDEKEKNNCKKK